MSIMEIHRDPGITRSWIALGDAFLFFVFMPDEEFHKVLASLHNNLRVALEIPPNYSVFFNHGGANAQFSAVPLNLMGN